MCPGDAVPQGANPITFLFMDYFASARNGGVECHNRKSAPVGTRRPYVALPGTKTVLRFKWILWSSHRMTVNTEKELKKGDGVSLEDMQSPRSKLNTIYFLDCFAFARNDSIECHSHTDLLCILSLRIYRNNEI